MKKKVVFALAVGCALLFTATSLVAHHAFGSTFDDTRPVTMKGVVKVWERSTPHSFLFVETKDANGNSEYWALEGPSPNAVMRSLPLNFFKAGDAVEFCAYPLRPGRNAIRSAPEPISLSLRELPKDPPSTMLAAELLKVRDGSTQVWLQHGQTKCREAWNLPALP